MNPLASGATTKSTSKGRACSASCSIARPRPSGSANSGVASLNVIPSRGKSGISLISSLSSLSSLTELSDQIQPVGLAQVPGPGAGDPGVPVLPHDALRAAVDDDGALVVVVG